MTVNQSQQSSGQLFGNSQQQPTSNNVAGGLFANNNIQTHQAPSFGQQNRFMAGSNAPQQMGSQGFNPNANSFQGGFTIPDSNKLKSFSSVGGPSTNANIFQTQQNQPNTAPTTNQNTLFNNSTNNQNNALFSNAQSNNTLFGQNQNQNPIFSQQQQGFNQGGNLFGNNMSQQQQPNTNSSNFFASFHVNSGNPPQMMTSASGNSVPSNLMKLRK